MTNGLRLGIFLLAFCSYEAAAKDIFVSTTGDDANTGATSSSALKTLAAASGKAAAGDIVRILPGTYREAIKPTRSGIPGKPITYKADGGDVVLTHTSTGGLRAAFDIQGVSHIVIDGIDVDGVQPGPYAKVHNFALIQQSSNIVVRNCSMKYANAYNGFYVTNEASYVTLEDCVIDWNGMYDSGDGDDTSDWGNLVMFEEGTHHGLIQRNRLYHGPHEVITVLGDYNIVQDNYLDNKYTDVYGGGDLGGRVGAMVGFNNVYQRNLFLNAGRSSDSLTNSFTKFEGELNIARLNVFAYGNQEGVASDAGEWSPIAYDNRLYNNTFYRIGAGAWRVCWYDTGKLIGNMKFMNNVIVDSRMRPWTGSFANDITIAVKEFNAGDTAGNEVVSNMFSPFGGKEPAVLIYGGANDITLKTAETMYPRSFRGNVWKRPIFISSDPRSLQDFELQAGSPGIDEGAFLTKVVGAGTSSNLKVGDSKFFIDGFGLIPGDVIRLQGTSTTARVVAVDHLTNTLKLSAAVTFSDGQGVALSYEGTAPDMGARERGANGTKSRPRPPSIARL